MESFKCKEGMSLDPGEICTFKPQCLQENSEWHGAQCGTVSVCSLALEPSKVFSGLHTGHHIANMKINKMSYISPGKMGLFGICKELQFKVCKHGEPLTSPCTAWEGECFLKREEEVGRTIVNQESLAFHRLSPCQERRGVFLLPIGLCYSGHESSSSISQLNWDYRVFFF